MKERARGICRRRVGGLAVLTAVLCLGIAGVAVANNLDKDTAIKAARYVAKQDCKDTRGCKDYFVRGMHRVSRHKAIGKIHVISVKKHVKYDCTRQIAIKLDHETGDITYGVSRRRCDAV